MFFFILKCIFHSVLKNRLNFISVTFENMENCLKPEKTVNIRDKIVKVERKKYSSSKYASKSKQVSNWSHIKKICV